ncbi:MAG: hypothetical protein B6U87_01685 [Candidatus Aenigmarchaeota archaeon ex4484_52]|nr:MAG: hypothetical protein B6U87_01685 [Candidatus Aenigmarchaeota archaeon ex4484_52]
MLGIFISFFAVKLYLNFIKKEKNRINFLSLKKDFSEIFLQLLASVGIYYLFFIFIGVSALISFVCFTAAVVKFGLLLYFFGAIFGLIFIISIVAIPLALFYLNYSIIIGKNKIIPALKQSIDLMKNNFLYSVSRMLVLIITNIILVLLFILIPFFYLFLKISPSLASNFAQMSKIAQQEQITQIFVNFASTNKFTAIIFILVCLFGIIIIHLLNRGFISNMYLKINKKKQPKKIQ